MVTKKETLRLIPSYLRKPCVSNLFMAKGHTHYVLVRGSHVGGGNSKWYTKPPELWCSFYSIYLIYKFGREPQNATLRAAVWRPHGVC